MKDLEKQFDREMQDVYTSAKQECGYNATRFLQMLSKNGGVQTAKQLIKKEGGTYGFSVLWEKNRLDLTVEARVLKPEYHDLFSDDDRAICRERLKQFEKQE